MVLIAENDEIKMEFAQKEGFRKLLHLLLTKEEKVYQVISKALLHFLHLDNTPNLVSKIENVEEKVNFQFFYKGKIKILVLFAFFTRKRTQFFQKETFF